MLWMYLVSNNMVFNMVLLRLDCVFLVRVVVLLKLRFWFFMFVMKKLFILILIIVVFVMVLFFLFMCKSLIVVKYVMRLRRCMLFRFGFLVGVRVLSSVSVNIMLRSLMSSVMRVVVLRVMFV